ncbi:Galactinol--sucrose galactosyltransferase [Bienertia sinuspersici]
MAPSLTKGANQETLAHVDGATTSTITLEDSTFFANGHPFLTHVPPNVTTTSLDKPLKTTISTPQGCFVGFHVDNSDSRHVVPIGKLKGIRFMGIFRFKVWWTTHWTGNCGNDVEHETQIMILDKNDLGRPYVLLAPILEGSFRASLQPSPLRNDDVCLYMESGSTQVTGSAFQACLYMHVGHDPYDLVQDTFRVIQAHLGTFKLLEEKNPPAIVDKFGWCTWDAFYLKVNPKGIQEGVRNLTQGGCPPGLVLIDDGWQSISHDCDPINQEGIDLTSPGEQMPCRLVKFDENYKFRDYKSPKGKGNGLGAFISDLKEEFKTIEHVYVWHALMGYWGGIRPNVANMPNSRLINPKLSKALQMTMEDLAVDKIVENGVGLVPPEKVEEMFEGLHSYLEASGIDGVKVDVIHLLEMLAEDYGGRVELAKAYYKALTASVKKHFKGNGVIASMQHCNDFMLLGTHTISLGRVGDDFWCTDPNGDPNGTYWLQGLHMVHCAYNSLWMGNFIHPDWDMFQSTHPCAEFHAASRAISGGPIYVSDCVGQHNFELLKRLVLPNGSILSPKDVEWSKGKNPISTKGVNIFAVYTFKEKKLRLLKYDENIEITLDSFDFELLSVSPVTILRGNLIQFAPIGLVNMLNSGGAIDSIAYRDDEDVVKVGVKGVGEFVVFSSEKPKLCRVNGENVEFSYEDCIVRVQVLEQGSCSRLLSMLEYEF